MRKLRNLTGMPVICNRKKIGRVIQAQLSNDLSALDGIWIDAALRGTRYIPAEHIGTVGEVAVIADQRGKRKKMNSHKPVYRAVSTDGQRLGAITGAEIDEVSLMVCALELSRGFWDDIYSGRLMIRHYSVDADSAQTVIVDSNEHSKEGDVF